MRGLLQQPIRCLHTRDPAGAHLHRPQDSSRTRENPPEKASVIPDVTAACPEAQQTPANQAPAGSEEQARDGTVCMAQCHALSAQHNGRSSHAQWPETRVSSAGQSPGLPQPPYVTAHTSLSDCFAAYSLDCVTRNQTKKTTSASSSVANAIESILLLVCVLIRSFLFTVHARNAIAQRGTS